MLGKLSYLHISVLFILSSLLFHPCHKLLPSHGRNKTSPITFACCTKVQKKVQPLITFPDGQALLQTAVQMHTSTHNGSMMGQHRINGVDVTLPVDMDGSRLLVHATRRNPPTTGCKLVKVSCVDMVGGEEH